MFSVTEMSASSKKSAQESVKHIDNSTLAETKISQPPAADPLKERFQKATLELSEQSMEKLKLEIDDAIEQLEILQPKCKAQHEERKRV
jgi:hypothetical protein